MTEQKKNAEAVESFAGQLEVEGRSLWQDARRRFASNKAAVASLVTLAIICILAIVGPFFSPYNFEDPDWVNMNGAPSLENGHWFGTDTLGRDLFVRTMMGARVSMLVGLMGALVAVVIGTVYGATSGYMGGRIDNLMMRTIDILSAIPFMFLVILMCAFFGRSIFLIFVAIGAVSWLDMARIVRGMTMSIKGKEFIEAAYTSGVRDATIIRRHIVPNVLGIVAVYSSLLVPGMILFESFLSFLGLGVQEPMTSWGALVSEGAKTMDITPWQLMFPAAFLVVTLFCMNFIGDGLRDALDPKDH